MEVVLVPPPLQPAVLAQNYLLFVYLSICLSVPLPSVHCGIVWQWIWCPVLSVRLSCQQLDNVVAANCCSKINNSYFVFGINGELRKLSCSTGIIHACDCRAFFVDGSKHPQKVFAVLWSKSPGTFWSFAILLLIRNVAANMESRKARIS